MKCYYKVLILLHTFKIIPNGVSDELLYNASKFKRKPNIISVSRITPSKGIDILIKAYSNIALKFPDWKLLLVGPVEDKKYYKFLNSMIKDLGLKSRVKFLGAISEDRLKILYLKSSIYCLCSRRRAFQ